MRGILQYVVAMLALCVLVGCAPSSRMPAARSARICANIVSHSAFERCMQKHRANPPSAHVITDERRALHREIIWLREHPHWGSKSRRTTRILELKMRLRRLPPGDTQWKVAPVPPGARPSHNTLPPHPTSDSGFQYKHFK
jgi:hypothetical protein